MATFHKTIGTRLLSTTSGLMFCENCEKIVGSINFKGYKYLNLAYVCTCGNYGSVELIKHKHKPDTEKAINRMPVGRNHLCICRECNTPMLSVIGDRVENYSFVVECTCGATYDTKPNFDHRLGETLKLFKRMKEE